jgi:hypothetical protein
VYKNNVSACYKPKVRAVSRIYITLENVFISCNGIKQSLLSCSRVCSVQLEVFFSLYGFPNNNFIVITAGKIMVSLMNFYIDLTLFSEFKSAWSVIIEYLNC